jgi:hypothetical protein
MPPLPPFLLRCAIAIVSVCGTFAIGQDEETTSPSADSTPASVEGVGIVPKLKIARKEFVSFLSDEALNAAHGGSEEGEEVRLEGVFTVGADSSRYAFFWDPVTCRLLGALDLESPKVEPKPEEGSDETPDEAEEADKEDSDEESESESAKNSPPSPFFLIASGPSLLSSTAGGSGDSSFFGLRLVEGKPEFLYQQGSLLIEERLWLENGGDSLQQHFAFREMDTPLVVKVPEEWRERVTADRGEWKDLTLTVPREEANELRLTYRLKDEETQDAKTEAGTEKEEE